METHNKESEEDIKLVHLKKNQLYTQANINIQKQAFFAFPTATSKTESHKVVILL
jgi:hypothetical protein